MSRELPIIFSTEMVRAILAGRKTQTRRLVKNKTALEWLKPNMFTPEFVSRPDNGLIPFISGDILYVRESYVPRYFDDGKHGYKADWSHVASELVPKPKWKPSIHMPKDAARIFLKVTGIRAERLHDISEQDAIAEGIQFHFEELFQEYRYRDYDKKLQKGYGHPDHDYPTWREATSSFQSLWQSIHDSESWDSNPWVWVIEFEVVEVKS